MDRSNNTLPTFTWFMLWGVLTLVFAYFLPGFSEFDTSKYLTISQQMMREHQYLLAFWEGHPYSDKPPLLFWMFIAGWRAFGFSNWWPQTVVMGTAFLSMLATQRLSLALWPKQFNVARLVPLVLLGCFYWVWFAKQIRVDSLLVLATVLSVLCLIKTLQGQPKYWVGYILALGLGGFAKGPVILAFVLLPAIFLPAMTTHTHKFSPKWFGVLGLTTILGMALPLAWAIPAAIQGGDLFTQEIFYRQITHRQHMQQTSFFFYLQHLLVWLLPWSLYPPVYKNLRALKIFRPLSSDTACLFIIVCGLFAFSFFGQKLPHYIYPLFPFFALLIARVCAVPTEYRKGYQWPMAVLTLCLALFCLLFPYLLQYLPEEAYLRGYFLQEINLVAWGWALLVTALLLFTVSVKTTGRQILLMALANFVIALFVNSAVLYHYEQHIDNKLMLSTLLQVSKPVVAYGNFTDVAIQQFIQQHHILHLSEGELARWWEQPKGRVLLTADKRFLGAKKKPLVWYFQSRFSIVGLYA